VTQRKPWSRQELLIAFKLYCEVPFGKLHSRNPAIIKYATLIGRTPSALAMKLNNIASLDPAITETGRQGLPGASAADRAMWAEMESDWNLFVLELRQAIEGLEVPVHDQADDAMDYTGQERVVQGRARVGQDFFRKSVLSAYRGRCCITGLAEPRLLVASHIVPWKEDKANRLNPRNGLCLSMLHDKAFDAGIITFNEDLTLRVSRKYFRDGDAFFADALLSYEGRAIAVPEKFRPAEEFLAFHRERVFERA